VITDNSRNPDGTAPVTVAGRPLFLHLWYPTTSRTQRHVRYSWNTPVYNQNPSSSVYPGLPDLPALTFTPAASLNPVLEKAPLARDEFPLLIATHGNLVAAGKNMPDTLESLASHGYIIASIEHTGNDDASYQASFLEGSLHIPLGPNPSLGAATILQRVKDVSFVIDSMLQGTVDKGTGLAFSKAIQPSEIGVLGYSLGGETSLAAVSGISSAKLPAEHRIKAAFMAAGSNYGLLLNTADYANVTVPVMFWGNDSGMVYSNFNQFTGTPVKYLVDIAGVNHHVGGYQSSWCPDFHNSMSAVNPAAFPTAFINPSALSPADIVNYVFDATFYFSYTGARESGVYDYCDGSVFDGVSDAQLQSVLFGNASVLAVKKELQQSMPLKTQVPIEETTRLTNWYAVSFFNKTLKQDESYDVYLKDSQRNRRTNPLAQVVSGCERVKDHPIDLHAGDKITFVPVDRGYQVSVTSGAAFYDRGTIALNVAANTTAYLSYPGFSFAVPGQHEPVTNLVVSQNGLITARTSSDFPSIDDNGSPWYTRGQLLLSNQFTIAALMKGLDARAATAAGGGVYGYLDAAMNRVIVTYLDIPSIGTTAPNSLQVAMYSSGKIEMIFGDLAATGAAASPSILGTIGIASGRTRASDLRATRPIRFSRLKGYGPVYLPFRESGAIYEQFHTGTGASCSGDRNDGDEGEDSVGAQ
jgi:predicted dienelactone hydrolase